MVRIAESKRLADLPRSHPDSLVRKAKAQLFRELGGKGLSFRPHVWISSDWFSPDGVAGFAVPFYLNHPRLLEREQREMGAAEGGTHAECMQLMRHECGHALCTAYRLQRLRRTREAFGRYSTPYRRSYRVDPTSRDFVLHLDGWYAQSHPAEDFAETFAVWLDPASDWKKRYREGKAREKLEFMDRELASIGNRSLAVEPGEEVEPIESLEESLDRYYKRKRRRYALGQVREDAALLSTFALPLPEDGRPEASGWLQAKREAILRAAVRTTDFAPYALKQELNRLRSRAHEVGLRRSRPGPGLNDVARLLVSQTRDLLRTPALTFRR